MLSFGHEEPLTWNNGGAWLRGYSWMRRVVCSVVTISYTISHLQPKLVDADKPIFWPATTFGSTMEKNEWMGISDFTAPLYLELVVYAVRANAEPLRNAYSFRRHDQVYARDSLGDMTYGLERSNAEQYGNTKTGA